MKVRFSFHTTVEKRLSIGAYLPHNSYYVHRKLECKQNEKAWQRHLLLYMYVAICMADFPAL